MVRQLRGAVGAAVGGGDDEGFAGAAEVAFHDLSPSAVVVTSTWLLEAPTLRRFFALARIISARRLRAADE